ncbi:hypothetical protein SRIMM317S_02134 [Streptomyces rimosus subsp. rimosus]
MLQVGLDESAGVRVPGPRWSGRAAPARRRACCAMTSMAWNSGWRAVPTVRLERVDEPLERHVLVRVRGEVGFPYAGAAGYGEGGRARGVRAQHQGVDEEADQVVQRRSVRPATAMPMGMSSPAPRRVRSAASAACTTIEHGRAAARAPGRARRPACAVAADAAGRAGVTVASRRARPVVGQRDPARQSGERRRPVGELHGGRGWCRCRRRCRAGRAATGRSRRTGRAAGHYGGRAAAARRRRARGRRDSGRQRPAVRSRCGAASGQQQVLARARARTDGRVREARGRGRRRGPRRPRTCGRPGPPRSV